MLLMPLTMTEKDSCRTSVDVIILKCKNPAFEGFAKPFDIELCGKKMWKYVEEACVGHKIKTTICTPSTNIVEAVLPMLTASAYTLLLFSDTPLVLPQTIHQIVDFATKNHVQCLDFGRGYIFETKYAKNQKTLAPTCKEFFGDDDFVEVYDLRQLEFVAGILKNRIFERHQKHGVCFKDMLSTFVDANAEIQRGVVIEPNNQILGNTVIKTGTHLLPNNIVINSQIGANCVLCGAFIKNAKLPDNSTVSAFEKIEG